MPQMSPMKWFLISICFLIILSMMISIQENLKDPKKSELNNKNILWKW